MFTLFKKKEKPKTLMDKLREFKSILVGSMIAMTALTYWYGFIKPDYAAFKNNTKIVAAVHPTGALQIVLQLNQIPNIPVTVLITDGTHQLVHRHYDEGIATLFGSSCTTGQCIVEEITQLSFAPRNGHLEIKFVFNSWQTLFKNDFTVWKVPISYINSEGQVEDSNDKNNKFIDGAGGYWV